MLFHFGYVKWKIMQAKPRKSFWGGRWAEGRKRKDGHMIKKKWQVGGRQMWQWLNHTHSAPSDSFPQQELKLFSTDVWPFDEFPQCNRTCNPQRFHLMCQRMTVAVASINDSEHRLKKHLCFCVLRSIVLLDDLESWLGSSGAFVLQMLLVFIARPVLRKSQHLSRVGWFCRCVVKMGPCAFWLQNTQVSEPAHLPRRANSKFYGVRSDASSWMWWGKAGLRPVAMEGGG